MKFNERMLKKLQQQGKIRGYNMPAVGPSAKAIRKQIPAPSCREVEWLRWNLQYWCNAKALQLAEEHRFHPERKWRFDFALPSLKIGIEYEGLNSDKSRHTTMKGYTGDAEKYNAAQAAGWRIVRVTVLNYKTILQQLNSFL
jgi:very-short-patch-repair endonuclease